MERAGPGGRQNPVGSFEKSTARARASPYAVNGNSRPRTSARFGVYGACHTPLRSGSFDCAAAANEIAKMSASAAAGNLRFMQPSILRVLYHIACAALSRASMDQDSNTMKAGMQ